MASRALKIPNDFKERYLAYKAQGLPDLEITELFFISIATLKKWKKETGAGGKV
jgi:transposase